MVFLKQYIDLLLPNNQQIKKNQPTGDVILLMCEHVKILLPHIFARLECRQLYQIM